mmetsp:Transcript_62179/g.108757  ORF Transcript_62179/g.108757 Transcript_62179/m.108757 type:complete len:230 (-) Transcript_62179:20-709(-)
MTNFQVALLPEPHLVAAWVGSVLAFAAWFKLWLQTPATDVCIIIGTHVVVLPIIRRGLNLVHLPALGCLMLGLGIGFQLIDLCFDFLIIYDHSLHDGLDVFAGRKVAWFYYNTMLNAKHVNVAIALFLLVGQFGAMVGITRSPPHFRRIWITLVGLMVLGNGGYLFAVVPRYIAIRASVAFDERFFDGWWAVLAARTWLFVCLGLAIISCFSLLLDSHAERKNGKIHMH